MAQTWDIIGTRTVSGTPTQVTIATVHELEYHGEWMGDSFVTVSVRSATPVTFKIGDFLMYRNERFEINYDPNIIKKASSGSYGDGFTYDGIKLYSIAFRLKDCGFKDVVLNDMYDAANKLVYSSMGQFSFFAGSVEDLADRIQANLNRMYGANDWLILTPSQSRSLQRLGDSYSWSSYFDNPPASYGKTEINISVEDISCYDALKMAYNEFDLSFYMNGKKIIIGGKPVASDYGFQYGKGNGLYEIERTSDDSQRIVTKLYAYGSEKNIPTNYYANLHKKAYITGSKILWNIIEDEPLYSIITSLTQGQMRDLVTDMKTVLVTIGSTTVSATFDFMYGVTGLQPDGTGWSIDYTEPMVQYLRLNLNFGIDNPSASSIFSAYTNGSKIYIENGVNVNTWPTVDDLSSGSFNYPALLSINRLMLPGFPDKSLYEWVVTPTASGGGGGTVLDAATGKATISLNGVGYTACFSKDVFDPWIRSLKADTIGEREGTANFDSDDNEIYPTIEGTGYDEVLEAQQITDNGYLDGSVENGTDTFTLVPATVSGSDGGIEWNYGDGVSISMKDGYCVGREFQVDKAVKDGTTGQWTLTLKRQADSSLGNIYFPYKQGTSTELYQVKGRDGQTAGDKFVVLGIPLPQSFVEIAAKKLLEEALKHLASLDHQTYTYLPKIDEIEMARQHDRASAVGSTEVSVHDTIAAGMQMQVTDTDLNISMSPFIDQLTIKENGNNGIPTYDVVLRSEKDMTTLERIQSQIRGGNEAVLNMIGGAGQGQYISKIYDDTAQGTIRLIKGLQVGERFVSGLLGEGGVFRKEDDGATYLEADRLYIRMKAYFDTVEIRKYLHSGGNRIASSAGAKCVRVVYLDNSGNIVSSASSAVKFRCYFRGFDGDDKVTNDFVVGDMAYCHITNVESSSSLYQHHFWRLVVGKSSAPDNNGDHYIDISNRQSETLTIDGTSYTRNGYQTGSDVPVAQDDIIQLGNISDSTRRGAIIEYVSGADAPSYQIYQGIGSDSPNPFVLTGKNYISIGYSTSTGRAYMNVYGDFYFGDNDPTSPVSYIRYNAGTKALDIKANVTFESPTTHTDTTLEDFASAVAGDIEDLQSQIDGEIDTWYYSGVPTLNNAPAVDWTTTTMKDNHLGDLYYDSDTGYAYRFVYDGDDSTYKWVQIHDDAVSEALALANEALDTADHKRRVFLTTPAPPYDAGDLWVNATYPANSTSTDASNGQYYNDLLKCVTSKDESGSFAISDWTLASKYTDDSSLNTFLANTYVADKLNLQQQIDGKAETWYQNSDPSSAWTTDALKASHVGDLWYCTSDIAGTGFKQGTTWYYDATTSGSTTTYSWKKQDVPEEVFDKIDGKSSIYTNNPNSSTAPTPTDYKKNDLWILPVGATINGVTYKAGDVLTAGADCATYSASDWTKKVCYTDDTTVNTIITNYGNILGIQSPTAANVGQAVGFLSGVLNSNTTIAGGLILTSLIAMRDSSSNVWGGISGAYKTAETDNSTYKGHGIAAWYGGAMVDKQMQTSATDYARSLFRFDGSGYVAGGNLFWDASGNVTIQGYSINATTLQKNGSNVAAMSDLDNYVTMTTAQTITGLKSFANAIRIGDIYIGYDNTNDAIEIYKISGTSHVAANFYARGWVSALGSGSGGGGGTVSLNQPLSGINSASMGAPSTSGQTLVYNGSTWVYSGGVNVKVGSLSVSSTVSAAGQVSAATVNSSGYYVTGKDNTYVLLAGGGTKLLSEISGDYLPLTGGDVSGAIGFGTGASNVVTYNGQTVTYNGATVTYGSGRGGSIYSPTTNIYAPNFTTLASLVVKSAWGISFADESNYIGAFLDVRNGILGVRNKIGIGTDNPTYTLQVNGTFHASSTATVGGSVTAAGFIRSGGTASQFLKADGSVDSNTYLTSASLSGYATQTWVTNQGYATQTWVNNKGYATESWVGNQGYLTSSSLTGYATESWVGQQGYVTSSALANYLPLSGGSITGSLNVSGNVGIGTTSPSYKLHVVGYTFTTRLYLATGVYLEYDSVNSGVKLVGAGFYSESYISALGAGSGGGSGLTLNQPLSAINSSGLGTPSSSYQAIVWNGTSWVYSGNTNLSTYTLNAYGASFSSSITVSGTINAAGNYISSTGRMALGFSSTSSDYRLRVSGDTYINGFIFDYSSVTYNTATINNVNRIYANNHIYIEPGTSKNLFSKGGWNNVSDMREKYIVNFIDNVTAEHIAMAPVFNFRWKSERNGNIHLGSSAQYWQNVLPYGIANIENVVLTMDYGATALAAAVITARKVVDHERRIHELERENEILKERINELTVA